MSAASETGKKTNITNELFDFDPNVYEIEVPSQASAKPAPAAQTTTPAATPASAPSNTAASKTTDAALKAKFKAAAAYTEYRPSNPTTGEYTPSTAGELPNQNDYTSYLTESGSFPPELEVDEVLAGEISDPESDDSFSDDDGSRDLCSFPCVNCGAVPSFVMYELCAECLDKMGPQ